MRKGDLVEYVACPFQEILASGCILSVDSEYNSCFILLKSDKGEEIRQWIPIPHITKLVRISV